MDADNKNQVNEVDSVDEGVVVESSRGGASVGSQDQNEDELSTTGDVDYNQGYDLNVENTESQEQEQEQETVNSEIGSEKEHKDAGKETCNSDIGSAREEGERNKTDELGSLDKDLNKNVDFNQVQYGFNVRGHYEHNKMLTTLVDVTYNPRTREFIFLDTRGICTWNKDGLDNTVCRPMSYPKYQNNVLRKVVYARKYNVYFCLGKDFSLRVLNRNFDETCHVSSDLSSVMFLLFNPARDELITGGVKGTKIWEFRQVADRVWKEIKPMANYALFLKKELTNVGGSWVKKVELDQHLQHLYCCSESDVHCYDMDGKLLFKLEQAHRMGITGCRYSMKARVLITSSADSEVKVWSLTGGLVTTFRGHAKAITQLLLHPECSSLFLTSSLDGTVRLWSLDIMECLYVIQAATEGIEWMGLTNDRLLWTATKRNLNVWSLNTFTTFWALGRCTVKHISLVHGENKTSRVMAVGDDSSVRLISKKDQKNLTTVLPPPPISPLEQIKSVTYNREYNCVFILINAFTIWVYTTKTDPATRTDTWNLYKLQKMFRQKHKKEEEEGDSAK
ncbi:uncharacterized protein LOC144449242 [Glandiceps talaboti]